MRSASSVPVCLFRVRFPLSFILSFLRCASLLSGKARAEGRGATTSRLRTVDGILIVCKLAAMIYIGRMRRMIKQKKKLATASEVKVTTLHRSQYHNVAPGEHRVWGALR